MMRSARLLALLFMSLLAASLFIPQTSESEPPEPVVVASPVLIAEEVPQDPCFDYEALEAGSGAWERQHVFNHLDARGYARWRMACVYQWGTAEWNCLDRLWTEESNWNHHANGHGTTHGIPQANPGKKMASAGPDWFDNPRTQVRWGLDYIFKRYQRPTRASLKGTPCRAGY